MRHVERVKGEEVQGGDVYTFPGLQGVPQYLHDYHTQDSKPMYARARDAHAKPYGTHRNEPAAAASNGGLQGRYVARDPNASTVNLKVLAMAQNSATGRTVFHDLVTPHRSYIFAGSWKTPSAVRLERARQTRDHTTPSPAADPRVQMKRHRQSQMQRRQIENRARSVAAACTPHIARTASTNSERLQRFTEVRMQHFLKGHPSWHRDTEEHNDLVGAFQNPKLYGKPKVRTFSTFEEYLERTVNLEREIPIQFHPSQLRPVHRSFRSSRNPNSRSKSTEPPESMNFDDIAKQLGLKGERAATAMGFAPSREVVEMHRHKPPWLIDPAIFVRAYADTGVKETDSSRFSKDGSRSPLDGSRSPTHLLADLNLSEPIEEGDLHN